jgi:hypothetical protein
LPFGCFRKTDGLADEVLKHDIRVRTHDFVNAPFMEIDEAKR